MSTEERLSVASSFILQAPPGEVNDVFNDVQALVNNDKAFESGILPALEKYNIQQFITAQLPDDQGQLLVCPTSAVEGEDSRFLDPASSKSWKFNHLKLSASDPLELQVNSELENFRSALQDAYAAYCKEHYASGISAVYSLAQKHIVKSQPASETAESTESQADDKDMIEDQQAIREQTDEPMPEEEPIAGETVEKDESQVDEDAMKEDTPAPVDEEIQTPTVEANQEASVPQPESQPLEESLPKQFALYLVGNKYNPKNYWTGRWRSSYTADLEAGTLEGKLQVAVHFYEQGNVQLSTTHNISEMIPTTESDPSKIASTILKTIKTAEQDYQVALNDSYKDMSEGTFKGLRRALPVTKMKMDWNKVANFRLGQELSSSRS